MHVRIVDGGEIIYRRMKSIICALVLLLLVVCVAEDHWGEDWKKLTKRNAQLVLLSKAPLQMNALVACFPLIPYAA